LGVLLSSLLADSCYCDAYSLPDVTYQQEIIVGKEELLSNLMLLLQF